MPWLRRRASESLIKIILSTFGLFKKMPHLCTALSERRDIYWKDGRVIDCTGLENRRTARYRGFESLSFRKSPKSNEESSQTCEDSL